MGLLRSWVMIYLALTAPLPASWATESIRLMTSDSTWRYHLGLRPPPGGESQWRNPDSPLETWPQGIMPFRYGDGQGGTLVDEMFGRATTLYLRGTFQIDDPEWFGGIDLQADFDDGFQVWINGQPMFNVNAPSHPRFDRRATRSRESGRSERFELSCPPGLLRAGENIICIQGFNISKESSDFYLDVGLVGIERDPIAPRLIGIHPNDPAIETLSEVTLAFSEPVRGLTRKSLLLNGQTAGWLKGELDRWTFFFLPPSGPTATLDWNRAHEVYDFGRPPNAMKRPNEPIHRYRLQDERRPTLIDLVPPAGATVSQLDRFQFFLSEPIEGFDAGDLRINGNPPRRLSGTANGPWRIEFAPIREGAVSVVWRSHHGIQDLASPPNPLLAEDWAYTVAPGQRIPDVRITEILASNRDSIVDEDGARSDWIEIQNFSQETVSLEGWSLTDHPETPSQWILPDIHLAPDELRIIFASGKNRRVPDRPLHTNFKLSATGEFLLLLDAELPRRVVDRIAIPEPRLRPGYAFGRGRHGTYRILTNPTPGHPNSGPEYSRSMAPPRFGVPSHAFVAPFRLELTSTEPGAVIHYTTDHSEPTPESGILYQSPIPVRDTTIIRARVFGPNALPSETITQSYIQSDSQALLSLPLLSLVSAEKNLWGPTGIMESNPRNTTKRGIAWERDVSVEWMPRDSGHPGFNETAGLRIQGGEAIRRRYRRGSRSTASKYSFRLYFRGQYGRATLNYPLFPTLPLDRFKQIVLRAGMNDAWNPFLVDELNRRLFADMGHVSAQGTFANLFLNGEYQGYYNPTERIDPDFLQSRHGGSKDWDLIAQFGEVRSGDMREWQRMKRLVIDGDLSEEKAFRQAEHEIDLDNFIDYILLCVYANMDDWPYNNWRAARERVPEGKWRFYIWDAERSFGSNSPPVDGRRHSDVTGNNLTEGPLTSDADIARIFRALMRSPLFRLRFADRVHRQMYHGGSLTDEHISRRHSELAQALKTVIPRMDPFIAQEWIPHRRRTVLRLLDEARLHRSANAPRLSHPSGSVPEGTPLRLEASAGQIYVTLDGTDPSGGSHHGPRGTVYQAPIRLRPPVWVKARTWSDSQWSALAEARFLPTSMEHPLRITEIMYHPIGGPEYEFLAVSNPAPFPVDLAWHRLRGVQYAFGVSDELLPGKTWFIASDKNPSAFRKRYPKMPVSGWFGGNLSNSGEPLGLDSPTGKTLLRFRYDDQAPWPRSAAGGGASLRNTRPLMPIGDPEHWMANPRPGRF